MSSSSRMLALLSLLQARRDWPGRALADRLEISERTVRRDVERLRDLGYRIRAVKGPDGGYRLDAGSELPPLLFDDEQAVVLAVALQSIDLGDPVLQDAATRALVVVRQVMPPRLRHRIDAVQVTRIGHPVVSDGPIEPDGLVALGTAIRDCTAVRFDYATPVSTTDAAGLQPAREVHPHGLVARSGRWYLVAWSAASDDWRIYRLDRLRLRLYTGPRFQRRPIPGGDLAQFVASRFAGAAPGESWPCVGTVALRLSASEVTLYAGDGTVEQLGDDRCRLTLGAWSWMGLAATIARFDADVEEVSPRELSAAFASLARRFAAVDHTAPDP